MLVRERSINCNGQIWFRDEISLMNMYKIFEY